VLRHRTGGGYRSGERGLHKEYLVPNHWNKGDTDGRRQSKHCRRRRRRDTDTNSSSDICFITCRRPKVLECTVSRPCVIQHKKSAVFGTALRSLAAVAIPWLWSSFPRQRRPFRTLSCAKQFRVPYQPGPHRPPSRLNMRLLRHTPPPDGRTIPFFRQPFPVSTRVSPANAGRRQQPPVSPGSCPSMATLLPFRLATVATLADEPLVVDGRITRSP